MFSGSQLRISPPLLNIGARGGHQVKRVGWSHYPNPTRRGTPCSVTLLNTVAITRLTRYNPGTRCAQFDRWTLVAVFKVLISRQFWKLRCWVSNTELQGLNFWLLSLWSNTQLTCVSLWVPFTRQNHRQHLMRHRMSLYSWPKAWLWRGTWNAINTWIFFFVYCHEVWYVPYLGTKSTPCRVVG